MYDSCFNKTINRSVSFRAIMGSFSSNPKIENEDNQDKDTLLPENLSRNELLEFCYKQLNNSPSLLSRSFRTSNDIIPDATSDKPFRILQWNVLSQTLCVSNDKFVRCPESALLWTRRRCQLLLGLLSYSPDIICLQEVDHFDFLNRALRSQGYTGIFYPKPDSPCVYVSGNNGPDGCAIFYNRRFEMLSNCNRILQVWKIESNQVAMLTMLKDVLSGEEVCIVTTHLKARKGALLSSLRNEQGKDLLSFVQSMHGERAVIICGDFNAEPSEPVYRTLLDNKCLPLSSAYYYHYNGNNGEPAYTTWKIREEGEICHTIDYIFYSKDKLQVEALLEFPTEEEIGKDRLPSMNYPSDHFSLACDFSFTRLPK